MNELVEVKEKAALSLNEFCRKYSICRSYAYLQIKEGRLETRKAGRKVIIRAVDAEAWLNSLPSGKDAA